MYVIIKAGEGYWDGGMWKPSKARARHFDTLAAAEAHIAEHALAGATATAAT